MPIRNCNPKWKFPDPVQVPADFQLGIGDSSLVAKTLYQRGLTSPKDALAFLNPDLYTPCPPAELPGIITAASRITEAINGKERILIWGDFDVDGQTSTTLLVSSLQKIGGDVHHHIPIRAYESHGISRPVLSELIRSISPRLIITCDTGIDAFEEVKYAVESGIDVIITDHHQLPSTLPNALAIVNPNMLPGGHALRNLPGVGVAFKLIQEIYTQFNKDPSFLLDLVALGIVADVAKQTKDTRYLLQKGLEILRVTSRLGLKEIFKINNLSNEKINEDHIGFIIGPRLNALGRLDDANSCVDFFTTSDQSLASNLANQLEELNNFRQSLTQEIYNEAVSMITAYPELVEDYPIIVLQGPSQWHPGVIGIVASRLVERYRKPTIILSEDGDFARGSARSVPGVPISELIKSCDDLLDSHGGHPMAAGMSLPLTNVYRFRKALADNYRKLIGDSLPDDYLYIDAEISFQDINENFISDFHRLAPFGAGNPKLTFATRGVFTNENQIRPIGRSGDHRKINFTDSNNDVADFLWWNSSDIIIPDMPVDIAYTLEISTYRDQPQIQATLLDLRQSPMAPAYIPVQDKIELIDFRLDQKPLNRLAEIYSPSSSIIWAENTTPEGYPSKPRSQLSKTDTLIIWTTPPSRYVLSQAVKSTSPQKIIFLGINPTIKNIGPFLQNLLGLLKFQARSGKPLDLIRFSEVLALPEDVIKVGLEWIHSHGDFDLEEISKGNIEPGPGYNLTDFPIIDRMLKHMLREVVAYRDYFNKAHIKAIL